MIKSKLISVFIILALAGILGPVFSQAQQNKEVICTVYFTFIGCPNCAYTDPLVLTEWTKKYPHLVVIEYMWQGGDWQDPNSQFFGDYAQKHKTPAAVPQIVIAKNNIRLGRIDIPNAEKDIKVANSNSCLLLDDSVSFADLELSQLSAKPKIWANERILVLLENNNWLFQWNGEKVSKDIIGEKEVDNELLKNLLFTENISRTLDDIKFGFTEPQRAEFSGIVFPDSEVVPYVDFENAIKITLSETPAVIEPEEPEEKEIPERSKEEEIVKIPFIGEIKTEEFSLPVLTFLLGLADGFNPCAFFVLTFLLAALMGLAGARKKILLVGGIFVFCSALSYLLFMAVLLNVFKLGEKLTILTIIAGLTAIFAGAINIKDYFAFQKGISLTLPKSYKAKFVERVKNLSLAKSIWALIVTTTVIACTVNIYELLCTFGFPMVYTRVLTLRELPKLKYYFYLVFYNLVYVIPMAVVVLIFAITLGRKTFSQVWVRRLKLVSGFMILFLGIILLFQPKLLENIFTAFGTLIGAVIISGIVIFIRLLYSGEKGR